MQLLATLAALTALASAATITKPFQLVAVAPESPINGLKVAAQYGTLNVGGTQNGSTCAKRTAASLYLNATQLYLYTPTGQPQQQVILDNDNTMNFGTAQYYTSGSGAVPPSAAKKTKFVINANTGYITFNGISPLYCGGATQTPGRGFYFTNNGAPFDMSNCFKFKLQAVTISPTPPQCEYSDFQD